MYSYQVEKFETCLADMIPLLSDHWDEIATHKEVKKLDPDFDRYITMEEQGMTRVMTVRLKGELVGYCVTFIHHHLHYKTCITGLNDIFYLCPEYRGGTVGYRLLKMVINDLKQIGVNHLIIHMKVAYPFRNLLTKLGFHLTEENWEMTL